MPTFKFIRTLQHTDIVEVEAETYDEARELASEEPLGIHQQDESLIGVALSDPDLQD